MGDSARVARVAPVASAVVGDLTTGEGLVEAVDGVDAVVFVHGSHGEHGQAERVDYGAVRTTLAALGGRPVRIALMTAVGATDRANEGHDWKRRGERLVRASGNEYTVVRPGWFDYNDPGQRRIVLRQGDRFSTASPADGVIARDEIARVLVDSLTVDEARHKTVELVAEQGQEQADLGPVFAPLVADDGLDGALDPRNMPVEDEPDRVRRDLDVVAD